MNNLNDLNNEPSKMSMLELKESPHNSIKK